MTQTAFVLDHEEYIRYAARRAIHQYHFGSVNAPNKATSYSPECFDVIQPKKEIAPEEQATALEKEFEEEHLVNVKNRVRGAKECAIRPGPRLDRHPSDEDAPEEKIEDEKMEASTKRRRVSNGMLTSSGAATAAAEAGIFAATPASSSGKRRESAEKANATNTSPTKPTVRIQSPQGQQVSSEKSPNMQLSSASPSDDAKQSLLFSRVMIGSDEKQNQKARVTAVTGDAIEVITEGSWSTMNVTVKDVSIIDESHFGVSVNRSGPTDFGFLIPPQKEGGQNT